jgi:hypothetical protein
MVKATLSYAGHSTTVDVRDPACCYCDDCRGDGRRDPTVTHDPSKPPDTSDEACDARYAGLVAHLEGFVRPYFEDRARRRAWGLDPDPKPVAA